MEITQEDVLDLPENGAAERSKGPSKALPTPPTAFWKVFVLLAELVTEVENE